MLPIDPQCEIAYFSMEIELDADIPTYSGGLGVLAGDLLRAAADMGLPMVGVTLLYRKGYFHQRLDKAGQQTEADEEWSPEKHLEPLDGSVAVKIEGRDVHLRAWRYTIRGVAGDSVAVIFLDAQVPGNTPWDASLTDHLYGEDEHYRLCQEALLGLGGQGMLAALGLKIRIYHMNEGHSSLLTLALLEKELDGQQRPPSEQEIRRLHRRCVFTTHTPVPAGHDQFDLGLARQVLGAERVDLLDKAGAFHAGKLNMTYLALRFSHYINGVSMDHGQVSRSMFPDYPIHAITNGTHASSWTSAPLQKLYDRHIPEWRRDNLYLRYVIGTDAAEIGAAHREAKAALLAELKERNGVALDPNILTIGFARRAAQYKRPELVFSELDRLRAIAARVGPLQFVFGGKAHPRDEGGKSAIRGVFQAAEALRGTIPVVYVENYDIHWARLMTSGADLWLNTPHRPFEASGTSGMKAALNGVPSLSILDGWWTEGCIEGVTGWAIGSEELPKDDFRDEIASLYGKLERTIVPMFYGSPGRYFCVMRSTIALNGSFFNTQRMLDQYMSNAYAPEPE